MARNNTMTQQEITKFVFENLEELATTDLIELCRVAKEIHEKRTEQCRKDGLFGDYEGFWNNWDEHNKKNEKNYLKRIINRRIV